MKNFVVLIGILVFNLCAFAQGVFTHQDSVKIQITAPFQELFGKKGSTNYIMNALKESVEGTVSVINPVTLQKEIYNVTLKMRGNHSLGVCQFPKLKIKFTKEQTTKDRYFNKKSYDIATHCMNDVSAFPEYSTERTYLTSSPHREKFIYDLQEELEFISPRTQNAIIDYIDNTDANQLVIYSSKDAFLIESTSSMMKRLNAQYEVIGVKGFSKKAAQVQMTGIADDDLPEKLFMSVKENPEINPQEVIKLHLFNLLVGNFDFYIQVDTENSTDYGTLGLKNIKCLAVTKESWRLFTNDFNLAMVLGNNDQVSSKYAEAIYKAMETVINDKILSPIKRTGTPEDFSKTVQFFYDKKEILYGKADLLNNDQVFQKNYIQYLDIFYKKLNDISKK